MNFVTFLEEVINRTGFKNTLAADINEITFLSELGGWGKVGNAKDAKQALDLRLKQIDKSEAKDQIEKAKVMATETKNWLKANGYQSPIAKTWWTARPGMITKITGAKGGPNNPSDILVMFRDKTYLGISLKSAKKSFKIGFKNPGAPAFGKAIDYDIEGDKKTLEDKAIKKFKLSTSVKERKEEVRKRKDAAAIAAEADKIVATIRNKSMKALESVSPTKVKKYIRENILNVTVEIPYIKVTGKGRDGNYSVSILDPFKNSILSKFNKGKISFTPTGNNTIVVKANDEKLFIMRFKYTSRKLADSLKMSVE